jgi:hypothetical protein
VATGVILLAALLAGCAPSTPTPDSRSVPPMYLGLDAYRNWDKLPYLEIGDRVAGQSTADPGGTNNDAVNTLGTLPGGGRVLFDQAGPGVVTFLRMQEQYGAPWQLSVDGSAPKTISPDNLGLTNSTSPFPYPLSLNQAQSAGSNVIGTPLPYAKSLRFSSTAANGNFYSMYRKLPIDAALPPTNTMDQARTLLNSAGTDIAPTNIPEQSGTQAFPSTTAEVPIVTLTGRQEVRAIKFHVPFDEMVRFGNSRLTIYWDGESTPSVDAPVKNLTGVGAGVYQPTGRQLVQGLMANVNGDGKTFLDFNLYWPMPFTSSARIALVPADGMPKPVDWSVRYQPFTDPAGWVGKFHANYTDVPNPLPGKDMNFLDFRGSGKLVGTVVNFGEVGTTLEGDPHIYLDGSRTPQIAVTGTEEWGMGGDYWNNGRRTSLPMAGLPSTTGNPAGSDVDGSAEYRFLIADSIPFNDRIVVNWEHGALNDSAQGYRATMMWYGTPTRTAIRTDRLAPAPAPGDRQYQLTSGYEFTVQSPVTTSTVVATTSSSTFTMALREQNVGAFLRRTFDSCVANQRANVYIDGISAGTWYNAGGSPAGAGRCWRDDDFPLPKSLTAGKRSVQIRLDNARPGTGWTSADYRLFSFVPADGQ